jgi:Tfp pilus assembly protein PilW
MLTTQIQQGYSTQLDDVTVEEEARFALDWISRVLRSAGSNPYSIVLSACPVANTAFQGIRLDPNANGIQDDVRIQADINPPNGLLVGAVGTCTEQGEDITIAHDIGALTITRQDRAVNVSPVAMTEPIFTELRFTYLNAARATTTAPDAIVYAQVSVTGQSKALNPITREYTAITMQTEVRLRTR